jgi:hypothetical protein
MEVNMFKMFLAKLYYSIKGFLTVYCSKTKNFKVENYSTSIKNITYRHLNGRNFSVYMEAMEPSTGVVYFEVKNEKVPYWIIGILGFEKLYKKDFEEITINKEEII